MNKKIYTFIVELHHSTIIIEGSDNITYTLLVDHDVMTKIRRSNIRITFQEFKGIKKAFYYEETNNKHSLTHFILELSPRTRVEFRNNNPFDLRRENLLVHRRNIHF